MRFLRVVMRFLRAVMRFLRGVLRAVNTQVLRIVMRVLGIVKRGTWQLIVERAPWCGGFWEKTTELRQAIQHLVPLELRAEPELLDWSR